MKSRKPKRSVDNFVDDITQKHTKKIIASALVFTLLVLGGTIFFFTQTDLGNTLLEIGYYSEIQNHDSGIIIDNTLTDDGYIRYLVKTDNGQVWVDGGEGHAIGDKVDIVQYGEDGPWSIDRGGYVY